MRVVIQCAGRKTSNATFRTSDGRSVVFVACPANATADPAVLHAHPDDPSDRAGQTWRERVVAENAQPTLAEPLIPAGQLYSDKAYATLERHFGVDRLFILSAGWGLVRADFLLPAYDITFSKAADTYNRRGKDRRFEDFNALSTEPGDDTVFLGGKDYVPLFASLMKPVPGRKLILFQSKLPPAVPGFATQRYVTRKRTNWYYECAKKLVSGEMTPSFDPA